MTSFSKNIVMPIFKYLAQSFLESNQSRKYGSLETFNKIPKNIWVCGWTTTDGTVVVVSWLLRQEICSKVIE